MSGVTVNINRNADTCVGEAVVGCKGFLTLCVNHAPMSRVDLERIHEWATAKLSGAQEQPGAGQPYVKVRETVDAILARMNSGMRPSDGLLRDALDRNTNIART
jgi:hypothetical protein